MRIIRDLSELSVPLENTVVTIGNFDGVHLGHREIFRRVVTRAHRIGGTSVVFTFVPHPLKVLDPQRAPRLINSYAEKERLIEASCIDVLVCAPFSREFAAMSASRFVEEILVGKLGVRHMIVGYDYAFGRHREGDLPFLQRKGREFGFSVEELKPITADSTVYSSTRIRRMLMNGRVADVVDYLGRHYTVEGRVVGGERRGKKLGFPTANLETEKDLLPKPGVYAVKVRRGDSLLDGVVNIGSNPTFGAEGFSVEVHLLDFSEEIYDENLRLYFIERLRDEMPFPSVEALVKRISADVEKARGILRESRVIEYREYLRDSCAPHEKEES